MGQQKGNIFSNCRTKVAAVLFAASATWLFHLPSANAAEKVVIKYSPIEQSISVSELRTFADSGRQSSTIETILGQTKLNPDNVRKLLSASVDLKEVNIDLVFVGKALNTYVAEIILRDLGRVVHPPRTEAATVQALRSAIILSLSDDSKISAIEFLEKYPTEITIEGNLIEGIVNHILKDIKDLEGSFNKLIRNAQNRSR